MAINSSFVPDPGNLPSIPYDPSGQIVSGPDNVISDRSGRGSGDRTLTRTLEDPDNPSDPYLNDGQRAGRGGGSGGTGRGNRQGDLVTPVIPDIFYPDAAQSPEDNMQNLYNWLFEFIQNSGITDINANNIAGNYVKIMSGIAKSVYNLFESLDLDSDDTQGAIIQVIEKVTNVAQGYLDTLFTQVLNYQTWYLQQEYNSPANQLKRLSEAGLSSAFVFGNYNNTAASAAGVGGAMPAGSTLSGAGETLQQAINASKDRDLQKLQTSLDGMKGISDMVAQGVTSYKTLAEADNISRMTPLQIATSLQQLHSVGVQMDYTRSQMRIFENEDFRNWFSQSHEFYKQDVSAASDAVQQAQKQLEYASSDAGYLSFPGAKYIETEAYEGTVTDKDGHRKTEVYTLDQLKDHWEHHTKDQSGNTIFSDDDYRVSAEVEGSAKFDVLAAKAKAASKVAGEKGNKSGESVINLSENGMSEGYEQTNSRQGLDSRDLTLRLGNTVWKKISVRKRMDVKEYTDYMQQKKVELQKASDRYNALTTGERARWYSEYQSFLENYARGLSWRDAWRLRSSMLQNLHAPVQSGD